MGSSTGDKVRSVVSYIIDYLLVLGLIAVFTLLDKIEPYHQRFSLTNISIQYPYAEEERVPILLLAFLVGAVPLVIILVWTFLFDGILSHNRDGKGRFTRYSFKDRLWQANAGVLGLLLSISFAVVITASLKNAVGKPRPDLLSRCKPRADSRDAPVFGLSTSEICTQTDNDILKDGFRSFPSGHSSSAFGGLFYLSLFLAGKMHVLDKRGQSYKTFIVLMPSLGAALIAATRIMDSRHHGFDVLSGSLIGIISAWGAYRQYFPPIHESWRKGRAWHPRTWGKYSSHEVVPSDEPTDQDMDSFPKERPLNGLAHSSSAGAQSYNAESLSGANGHGLSFGRNDVEMGPTSRTRLGRRDRDNSRDGRQHSGSSTTAQNYSDSSRAPANNVDRMGVVTSRTGRSPSPLKFSSTADNSSNIPTNYPMKPYATYRPEIPAPQTTPGQGHIQERQYFVTTTTPSPPSSPDTPTTLGGHSVHHAPYLNPPSVMVTHHARGKSEVASFYEVGRSTSHLGSASKDGVMLNENARGQLKGSIDSSRDDTFGFNSHRR